MSRPSMVPIHSRLYAVAVSLLLGCLLTSVASAENLQPLHAVRGKKAAIRDIRGRQVILRGINVTALEDNFMANPNLPGSAPLTDADLAQMRDMGVNVIRLVISWSALEPRRGSLNSSYVARIKDTVARASRYGIYTVIDMHNDGWSKYLSTPWGERCPKGRFPSLGWDGAPEWATKTNGKTTCISDNSSKRSPAVIWAWINFWHNRDGIRHALVKAWGLLAARLAKLRAIAGYDILNAPDPAGISPGRQIPLLNRFNAATIAAIRKAEKRRHGIRHIVFFEPNITWRHVPPRQGSPSPHFTRNHNIVFAPHLYGGLNHGGAGLSLDQAHTKLKRDADKIAHRAAQYRTAVWLGEWKVSNGAEAMPQLWMQRSLLERHHWGSAYWQWEISCGNPHQFAGPFDRTPAPFTGTLNPVRCPGGTPLPPPTAVQEGLTLPSPRAAPGMLRAQRTKSNGTLTLSGSQPRCGNRPPRHSHRPRLTGSACDLLVWSPTEPHPHGRHLSSMNSWRVPGGWITRARVHGRYRFVSQ